MYFKYVLLVSSVYCPPQNSKTLYFFSMTSSFIIVKSLLLQDISVCFKSCVFFYMCVCVVREGRERHIHCKMHNKWKWICIITRIVKDSKIWICNQHIIYIIFHLSAFFTETTRTSTNINPSLARGSIQ